MITDTCLTVGEIFEGLRPETLRTFEALGDASWYPPGALVFATGGPRDGIFWVSSGQLSVSELSDDDRWVASRIAGSGEILGLEAALSNRAYAARARAEEPSEVMFMGQNRLLAFLSSHPEVAFRIVQRLSDRLHVTMDQFRLIPHSNPPKLPS
jgi:CRP-like cAMP-binding protein